VEAAGYRENQLREPKTMAAKTPATAPEAIPVTPDNFKRAETDWYFAQFFGRVGLAAFYHYRELPPLDLPGVRPNRDTLYSEAVVDLDAGPVTITLPDAGIRYIGLQVIDEDHYARHLLYEPGRYTYTKDDVGTRYMFAAVRTD
jgi:hypothetical protein